MYTVRQRVIAIIMLIASIFGFIGVPKVKALEFSSSIGTTAGTGSPLLNESTWSQEDWNPWELLTFGVFCSNFTVPFIDDYMSAFQSGKGGTDGRGLKVLQYGTGQDNQSSSILQTMLSYSIKMQGKALQPIKVVIHDIDINDKFSDKVNGNDGKSWKDSDGKEAIVNYLFFDESSLLFGVGNTKLSTNNISSTSGTKSVVNDAGIQFIYGKNMHLPEFYVIADGSPITVLDFRDGYDAQTWAAVVTNSINNSKYGDTVSDAIDDLNDNNSKLYLDSYGNIVTLKDNKPIVLYPACSNQHITKDKAYNFLTSTYMQDNYIASSGDTMLDSFKSDTDSVGADIASYVKNEKDAGRTIIVNDTDTALFKYIKDRIINSDETVDSIIEKLGESEYKELRYGNIINGLANTRIGTDSISGINLRIEPTASEAHAGFIQEHFFGNHTADSTGGKGIFGRANLRYITLVTCANLIGNWFPIDGSHKALNYLYTFSGKSQLIGGKNGKDITYVSGSTDDETTRKYLNYAMHYLCNTTKYNISGGEYNVPTQEDVIKGVTSGNTISAVADALFTDNANPNTDKTSGVFASSELNGLYKHWIVNEAPDGIRVKDAPTPSFFAKYLNGASRDKDFSNALIRLCAIYNLNSNMQTAINVMSVKEGTEFASFTPWIYLSYLDFYGVMNGKSKFNDKLFSNGDIVATSADKLFEGAVLGEEEKKKAITDYTFKLLDPKSGGEYRKNLISNFLDELAYSNYKKIVFGSDTVKSSMVSTSSGGGFLKLNTLAENFFIGRLVKFYMSNIVFIILVLLTITILGGIVTGRGLGGIIGGIAVAIGISILTPSCMDILPYVCNNMIQDMFSKNMSYWAISQDIANQQTTSKGVGVTGATDADTAEIAAYSKMLSFAQLDKTIYVKNDISKKIVETVDDLDFNELQKIKSAKWILPTVLRELTSNKGTDSYLSRPLTDIYQNCMSVYWFYRNSTSGTTGIQSDMMNNDSVESEVIRKLEPGSAITGTTQDIMSTQQKKGIFEGYINTAPSSTSSTLGISGDYHSDSRANDDTSNVHTYYYLLSNRNFSIPNPLTVTGSDALNSEAWDAYAEYVKANIDKFKDLRDDYIPEYIQTTANYNTYKNPVQQNFGYAYTTENVIPYFYMAVKDQFDLSQSIGQLIYKLQGTYGPIYKDDNEDELYVDRNGNEQSQAHKTFMRDSSNGQIKDFLDMEELFSNVIPYLYNVQVVTNGSDGTNGILGDEKLGDSYPIYKDNTKSWLFRSNWVSKIVESSYYDAEQTIGYIDSDGNHQTARIKGSLHPSSYAPYRDMCFSESQMESLGLTNADLSNTEASIIQVNKNTERDWTLLINYANTNGVKAEVLYRQMAVQAAMNFNKEFSSGNGMSSSKQLYPTTLDLENLSYDAVMKLLVMSATNSPVASSTDAMKAVIEDNDTIATILLLLATILNAYVVPLARDLTIAVITILFTFELLSGIIQRQDNKSKLLMGTFLLYLKYGVMTVGYYLVYYMLITISSPDEVLRSSTRISQSGSIWMNMLIVFIAAILYIVGVIKYVMLFVIHNRHDMGFEANMNILSNIADRARNTVSSIRGVNRSIKKGYKQFHSASGSSGFGSTARSEETEETNRRGRSRRKGAENERKENISKQSGYRVNTSQKAESQSKDSINKLIDDGKKKQEKAKPVSASKDNTKNS